MGAQNNKGIIYSPPKTAHALIISHDSNLHTHEAFHASGQASILHLQVRGISKSAFVPENETEQLIIQLQQCPGI